MGVRFLLEIAAGELGCHKDRILRPLLPQATSLTGAGKLRGSSLMRFWARPGRPGALGPNHRTGGRFPGQLAGIKRARPMLRPRPRAAAFTTASVAILVPAP